MILKIKNEDNCWSYFEGDNVVQHKITWKQVLQHDYPETLKFFRPDVDYSNKEMSKDVLIIDLCVQKENKVISRILTNRACYLMNDQGKTVDKLF